MTIDKILVSIFSVSGIVFTYWFFLMKNEKDSSIKEEASHHENH